MAINKKSTNFLQDLLGKVSSVFNLQPKKTSSSAPVIKKAVVTSPPSQKSSYEQMMADLDRIQGKLNPYINQANTNQQTVHNYLAGNYSRPNLGTINAPMSLPQAIYATNQGQSDQPNLSNYINHDQAQSYTSLVPFLQQLGDLSKQQMMPVQSSLVDVSPYLQQADRIRKQRVSNEQSILGGAYG